MHDNQREAAIKIVNNISIAGDEILADLVRPKDLAQYLVICTLLSLPRREIRETIL